MPVTLTAGRLGPLETARLYAGVADDLEGAVSRGELRVEIDIVGDYRPAQQNPLAADMLETILRAADRLERSLQRLHRAGGLLACTTHGTVGGPFLEIALMSDLHRMRPGASIAPAGMFDTHIPCAGGWSRMIERAGAGRAATLLISCERLGAGEAIAAGLCDAVASDGAHSENPVVPASALALRLAVEMSERATRSGGLTPRQARLLERASFALAFASEDPREGINAFFQGRPARFDGIGSTDPVDHHGHGAER